jgi:hypothetical protein
MPKIFSTEEENYQGYKDISDGGFPSADSMVFLAFLFYAKKCLINPKVRFSLRTSENYTIVYYAFKRFPSLLPLNIRLGLPNPAAPRVGRKP